MIISAFSVFVLLILLFALVFVGIAVKSVPQDYEWTVERFGRYVRTLEPGLALLIPIVERIDARLNMVETVLEVRQQSVITRDEAVATVDAIVFYAVLDAAKAAYEVSNLQLAILNGAAMKADATNAQMYSRPKASNRRRCSRQRVRSRR